MPSTAIPRSIDGIYDKIQAAHDAEQNESRDEQQLARIDGYITECRAIYQHRLVSDKTRESYEKMWQEMRTKREVDNMSGNSRFLYEMIAAAEDYEATFKLNLNNAVKNKWIGEKTRDNWMDRFNDPDVLEYDRKKWLKESFPKYLKGWESTAKTRKEVWKLAKKLKVTQKDVPELKDVWKIQDFLSLHFDDRKNKIDAAKAKLLALNGHREDLLSDAQDALDAAVRAGTLHPKKVGTWMRRVMESDDPNILQTLEWAINNWTIVKTRYDNVMPKLEKQPDKMRGFKQYKADKFLQLHYEQRVAYVEEAESREESDVNEKGRLASLRLDIRYAMDTGDWAEAEMLLDDAREIDPDDKAIRSMARYLEAHRTDKLDEKEQEKVDIQNKANEAEEDQRELMKKIPTNMRTMTEWAMASSNPNAVKRVWQVFYNRHWVIANGYSTEQQDREESFKEENQEETEESIVNGHDWKFARRVIKGETANDAGIRDECVKPQVIYTNRGGLRETFEGIERNADNAQFGYWTTLIDDEVPYDSVREALQFMYQIRTNDRRMREAGIKYSNIETETVVQAAAPQKGQNSAAPAKTTTVA